MAMPGPPSTVSAMPRPQPMPLRSVAPSRTTSGNRTTADHRNTVQDDVGRRQSDVDAVTRGGEARRPEHRRADAAENAGERLLMVGLMVASGLSVMPGLVPGIHVFAKQRKTGRRMPRQGFRNRPPIA